ncbi:MAG TPA: type II toxin-antitoxin system VapC family toxin [Armatimonadota bacterium]|nr:type II toxin-antitoxin system VapC family toxin [Armatimonadota bacterium]
MSGTLVDSNILLDIITDDPVWGAWSSRMLAQCANDGPLYINPLIYAEVSISFTAIEDVEHAVPASEFIRLPLSLDAAFLAGKAFVRYRQLGGTRLSTLPDFFIGAHAATTGLSLLTRDASRYTTYFPTLEVIAP